MQSMEIENYLQKILAVFKLAFEFCWVFFVFEAYIKLFRMNFVRALFSELGLNSTNLSLSEEETQTKYEKLNAMHETSVQVAAAPRLVSCNLTVQSSC